MCTLKLTEGHQTLPSPCVILKGDPRWGWLGLAFETRGGPSALGLMLMHAHFIFPYNPEVIGSVHLFFSAWTLG